MRFEEKPKNNKIYYLLRYEYPSSIPVSDYKRIKTCGIGILFNLLCFIISITMLKIKKSIFYRLKILLTVISTIKFIHDVNINFYS